MKGIYIHIPFCEKKCLYCDFVSYEYGDKARYFDVLKNEIIKAGEKYWDTVDTIFFGGGTPSSVSPQYIADTLETIRAQFDCTDDAEITLEANPGTMGKDKLAVYREIGINRISFGLQSADQSELNMLGRIHSYEAFLSGYNLAREYGFNNINIDLIFGLPKQMTEKFSQTLEKVIALKPEHLSCYALKLEKGTPLYHSYDKSPDMPDEQTERDMYHLAAERLTEAGYHHYETSNFAKPGFECKHNLKYWQGGAYLGFGVAAHGYVQHNNTVFRYANLDDINAYINALALGRLPVETITNLRDKDLKTEYIMLRLRLKSGIRYMDINQRFDIDFKAAFQQQITQLTAHGLITADEKGIYPTLKGFDLQNTLIRAFI